MLYLLYDWIKQGKQYDGSGGPYGVSTEKVLKRLLEKTLIDPEDAEKISTQLEQLATEWNALLQSGAAGGLEDEATDQQFAELGARIQELKARIAEAERMKTRNVTVEARMAHIRETLDCISASTQPLEYDDSVVRQLIE